MPTGGGRDCPACFGRMANEAVYQCSVCLLQVHVRCLTVKSFAPPKNTPIYSSVCTQCPVSSPETFSANIVDNPIPDLLEQPEVGHPTTSDHLHEQVENVHHCFSHFPSLPYLGDRFGYITLTNYPECEAQSRGEVLLLCRQLCKMWSAVG